jgi:hypothetical protein
MRIDNAATGVKIRHPPICAGQLEIPSLKIFIRSTPLCGKNERKNPNESREWSIEER